MYKLNLQLSSSSMYEVKKSRDETDDGEVVGLGSKCHLYGLGSHYWV